METAIRVSTRGGNQSASGPKPKADAMSVIECATVNEVTTRTRARSGGTGSPGRAGRAGGRSRRGCGRSPARRSEGRPGATADRAGRGPDRRRARRRAPRPPAGRNRRTRDHAQPQPSEPGSDREARRFRLDRRSRATRRASPWLQGSSVSLGSGAARDVGQGLFVACRSSGRTAATPARRRSAAGRGGRRLRTARPGRRSTAWPRRGARVRPARGPGSPVRASDSPRRAWRRAAPGPAGGAAGPRA